MKRFAWMLIVCNTFAITMLIAKTQFFKKINKTNYGENATADLFVHNAGIDPDYFNYQKKTIQRLNAQ